MKEYIGKEIKILSNLLRRKTSCNDKVSCGKAFQHGRIIGYLSLNESVDVFQKDIEKEFGIRRSTATSTLKKMEAEGLITRISVQSDLRLKKIVLTPKAKELHSAFTKRVDDIETQINSALSQKEREEFLRIIKKLQSSLE